MVSKKKIPRLRLSLEFLIFLALVTATTLLIRPLQMAIQERMTGLRDGLLARGEEFLGRKITYSSMGPSIFGTLDIRNIHIYGEDSSSLVVIPRLRISYSLAELLWGNPLEAPRQIRLDRPVVSVDAERDADLWELFSGPRGEGFNTDLLPRQLRIRIRGGEAALAGWGGRYRLTGLNLEASIREGRIALQGGWTAAASLGLPSLGLLPAWTRNLTMTGRVSGELSRDLRSGNFSLRIPSLAGDELRLRPITLNLALDAEKIEVRKVNDRSPLDLSLGYHFASRRLSAEFRAEDFSPRELFSFDGPRQDLNRWLALGISGGASFARDGDGALSYRVDLRGSLPAEMGPGDYRIQGEGNGEYARVRRLSLRFAQGSLGFTGGIGLAPFAPNGVISFSGLSLSGDGEMDGEITVATEGRNISFFGEDLSLGTVLLSALDALVIREDGGFSFSLSALRFTNMESYEGVGVSSFSADGSFDFNPRNLQASLVLDTVSLEDMLDMVRPLAPVSRIPLPALRAIGDISVTTEVFITTDFEHISYNFPRFAAAYEGLGGDIFAIVSVSGTDRRFEMNEGHIGWTGGSAEMSGYMDFSTPGDFSFSFGLSYRDLAYYLEGTLLDQSLDIQGSYGVVVHMEMTDAQGYSGYIKAEAIPIPIRKQFARLGFQGSFRFESPSQWWANLEQFELVDILSPLSTLGSLRIAGMADQDGMSIGTLVFDDGLGALDGGGSVVWRPADSTLEGSFALRNQEGTETYEIAGSLVRGAPDIRLRGRGIQLNRLLRNAYGGTAAGELRLFLDDQGDYALDMNLESLSARVGENELSAAARGVLTETELSLSAGELRYGGLWLELPLLRIDRASSLAGGSARITGDALGRYIDMSFSAAVEFAPFPSWFSFSRAIESFNGSLEVQNIRFDALESSEPFSLSFSRIDSELAVFGGPGDMLRLRVAGDGTFYAGLSYPSPIRGSLIGVLTPRTIDANTSNLYVDLASLWRFVPAEDIINFTGGFVTASVHITGPLGDPEFFGTAQGTSVRIEIPRYLSAEIGPTPVFITLEGNEMSFGPLTVPAGTGSGRVGGWFRFDRWIPNIFTLDIYAPPEDPIPFGFDIMGILARGLVSGDLNLSMEDYNLRITGDLTGHDAEITLDTQELSAGRRDRRAAKVTVITDIAVQTGRKVEFLWPSADFPILRANADIGTGVRITSDTVTGRYGVSGDVSLRSGEIFYVQRSFYIREGLLSFNENEIQFDPRITVRAEVRDRADDGPVIISMLVDNAPLKSFTARFESTPPLSQIDILSLLGQNITGSPSEGGGILQNALLASTDVLAQFSVVRWLEQHVRNFLGADMFSIRTQVLQNAVLRVTGLQDPIDRNGRVGNYFDNTTVFLGKYFGPDMFGQAMLSLRYDENQPDWGGLTPELDLGIELRGPLFDIRWNFTPRHWENIFINDHSFTLVWRRSF
jgi:hypothetical protein